MAVEKHRTYWQEVMIPGGLGTHSPGEREDDREIMSWLVRSGGAVDLPRPVSGAHPGPIEDDLQFCESQDPHFS